MQYLKNGFKPITPQIIDLHNECVSKMKGVFLSTLSLESMLSWLEKCPISYNIINNHLLYVVYDYTQQEYSYYMPLGDYKNIDQVLQYICENPLHEDNEYVQICDVLPSYIDLFQSLENYDVKIKFNRDNSDYIYTKEALQESLNCQYMRYNIRYFIRKFNPEFRAITSDDASICENLIKETYCQYHECEECYYGCMKNTINTILSNNDILKTDGFIVFVDNKPVAYAMFKIINDTAIFLYKKNMRNYRGLNEYIHQKMIDMCPDTVKYINYTEDMGVEGLRKYKSNLAEYSLLHKYYIQIKKKG